MMGLGLSSACTVSTLDIAARECPCASGWTCDEAQNLCVRGNLDPNADRTPVQVPPGDGDASTEPPKEPEKDTDIDGPPQPPAEADGTGSTDAGMADLPVVDDMDGGADVMDAQVDMSPVQDAAPDWDAGALPAHDSGDAAADDASLPQEPDECPALSVEPLVYEEFETYRRGLSQYGWPPTKAINRHYGFPHTGEHSLYVKVVYPTIGASVSHDLEQPLGDGTFHLSVYLFIDENVVPDSFSVLRFGGMQLRYTAEGVQLEFESADATIPLNPVAETIGRWLRVDIVVDIGSQGNARVCLDGKLAAEQALNTDDISGYGDIQLGVVRTAGLQGKVELFADDFVLQHSPAPAAQEP